jgi:hypothetical protein
MLSLFVEIMSITLSNRGNVHNNLVKVSRRFANFHWLHRSTVEIDGQRFVGSTLWFEMDYKAHLLKDNLSDFRTIQGFKKWIGEENKKNKEFFEQTVQKNDVVISHHLPTYLSVNSHMREIQTIVSMSAQWRN